MLLLHNPDAEELTVSDLHFSKRFESEIKLQAMFPVPTLQL